MATRTLGKIIIDYPNSKEGEKFADFLEEEIEKELKEDSVMDEYRDKGMSPGDFFRQE